MTPDFRATLQEALGPAYALERELTGGGMSRVFLAVEAQLRRQVVVKVLPPELAAGVNAERFRREIQLAAQLHHPHIVPLLSAGEAGNILYYTMPFIEGESLRSALRTRGRLGVAEVARILHDVVDALAYAHERGVVHRDIKPDNVLLSGKHAVVTDFGVAKALGSALAHHTTSGVTTAGVAIGTPAYMAPEQLAGDPAADHRVDLYAVGLLAYELLTGDSPFTGASPQATMAAQLTRVPPPLFECCPDVPEHLSAVIMKCLAKDPAERPQSADGLLDDLVAVTTPQGGALMSGVTRPSGAMLGGAGSAVGAAATPVTPLTPPGSTPGPVSPPAPRRRVSRALIGGLALAGLAAAALGLGVGRSLGDRRAASGTTGATVDSARGAAPASGADSTILRRAQLAGAATLESGARRAIVLSRAESIAIADAVRKRMDAEQRATARTSAAASSGSAGAGSGSDAGASVGAIVDAALRDVAGATGAARLAQPSLDSLRAEFQRVLADSVRLALQELRKLPPPPAGAPGAPRAWTWVTPSPGRDSAHLAVAPILAPPRGDRRRVAVMTLQNGTGRPDHATLVARVSDSLRLEFIGRRRASTEHAQEYEMVDGPTTRVAEQRAHNPVAVGFTLRADYVAHGMVSLRGDSVRVSVIVTDVRSGRAVSSYTGAPVPFDAPFGKVAVLAERSDERIEREIARAVRDEVRRREATERADRAREAKAKGAAPPR